MQAKAKGGLWVWGGWEGEASIKKAAKALGHILACGPGAPPLWRHFPLPDWAPALFG